MTLLLPEDRMKQFKFWREKQDEDQHIPCTIISIVKLYKISETSLWSFLLPLPNSSKQTSLLRQFHLLAFSSFDERPFTWIINSFHKCYLTWVFPPFHLLLVKAIIFILLNHQVALKRKISCWFRGAISCSVYSPATAWQHSELRTTQGKRLFKKIYQN